MLHEDSSTYKIEHNSHKSVTCDSRVDLSGSPGEVVAETDFQWQSLKKNMKSGYFQLQFSIEIETQCDAAVSDEEFALLSDLIVAPLAK